VTVAGQPALQTAAADVKQVSTFWRRGPHLYKLYAKPEGKWSPSLLLAEALTFAERVETHAASLDALDNQQLGKRLEDLMAAPDTKALRQRKVATFAKRLPTWTTYAKPTPYSADGVTITVKTAWLALPKLVRETHAQQLWKAWASLNTPTDLDKSSITLVDETGREVGGSGIFGSSVSVKE
jgi:hypothetical protein